MDGDIVANRLIVPQLAGLYRALAPFSYAFMRFCTGMVLVPHGVVKLFHGGAAGTAKTALGGLGPDLSLAVAYAVGCVELFGALMLAVGLLTRLAALSIIVEMSVIITVILWPNGYFWTKQGYEYALLWDLLCLAIFVRGGGRYSIDCLLPREF
ncbi:DoxX family protein [Rhodopila sp.]|uniref:DoxX family protein n=1 Tax=Rhodopila sp. TaxID=2480087 RepID=UPI003D12E27C